LAAVKLPQDRLQEAILVVRVAAFKNTSKRIEARGSLMIRFGF